MGRIKKLQPEGLSTDIAVVGKAPVVVNALPSSVTAVFKTIAPLLATMVPQKIELSLMVTAPSTFQYTFFACAPLINLIVEYVLVTRAPFIWITKTASAFPSAFR